MKQLIKVMKALSDPSRVKIVKMLQNRMMCVCEIQAALELAQPTVSKHLKVLEDAGLVSHQKDGLWVNYSISSRLDDNIKSILNGALNGIGGSKLIKGDLRRLIKVDRDKICSRSRS